MSTMPRTRSARGGDIELFLEWPIYQSDGLHRGASIEGFRRPFHNDNSLGGVPRHPGIILAVLSNGRDAVAMLRECVAGARGAAVVACRANRALYDARFHDEGDGLWTSVYEAPGEVRRSLSATSAFTDGSDLVIVTYGNGFISAAGRKLPPPTASRRASSICAGPAWLTRISRSPPSATRSAS